jgi:hypothetical protein
MQATTLVFEGLTNRDIAKLIRTTDRNNRKGGEELLRAPHLTSWESGAGSNSRSVGGEPGRRELGH